MNNLTKAIELNPTAVEQLRSAEADAEQPTLAEAIRLGAENTEQAFDWVGSKGEVCALSAAALAVKVILDND